MKRTVAVALLLAGACKPQKPGDAPPPEPLRLCVQNETVAYGNLIAYADQTRFNVMAGRQECKRVFGRGPFVALRAETTSGGALGPRRYAARLQVGGTPCWVWRLDDTPASAGDLSPCRNEPGADSTTTE